MPHDIDPAHSEAPGPSRPPLRVMPLILVGLMGLAGLAAGLVRLRSPSEPVRKREVSAAESRTPSEPASLFKSTHPAVGYVGDAACARCHAEIATTYRRHPMGQSLAPVVAKTSVGSAERTVLGSFKTGDYEFAVEDRGGRVLHRRTRLDKQGHAVVGQEVEVAYALGSGTRGTSYLIEHDGWLVQSPISWFAQEKRWDLSPGYEAEHALFERPVTEECLFCHANRVEPVAGSSNRFRAPIFRGHAVGCERCHGPGELHAQRREVREGRDVTIVNPRHLEPNLRDAVCEQCHLKGDQRVVRLDRSVSEYRPGLPLHRFLSIFLERDQGASLPQAVGHVEQMHASRCYRESQGRLGCISCHDPHERPAAEERVSYYRERCLECHEQKPCGLAENVRRARQRDDSCVACHMPLTRTKDIAHAAITDHRVLRLGAQEEPKEKAKGEPPTFGSYVHFHHDQLDARGQHAVDRDLGIALAVKSWSARTSNERQELSRKAVTLLDRALEEHPDDLTARESRASALWVQGRADEAFGIFQAILKQAPERENALASAAFLASGFKMHDEAVALWRKTLAVDPGVSARRYALAEALAQTGDWTGVADACREVLRIDPTQLDARKLLIRASLKSGDRDHARLEFETLLKLDPDHRDSLKEWFDAQH